MVHALLGSESNQYLVDWTAKQGRILTDSGNALQYYSKQNGYTCRKEELPHYYLEQGITHSIFRKWAIEYSNRRRATSTLQLPSSSPIVGVWDRPLFAGKWEHTTNNDEQVYNIQTGTLFVDLRIPKCKPIKKWERLKGRQTTNNSREVLEMMSNEELRLYARQHVFGGYSMLTTEDNNTRRLPLCTRHHCIDWNYIPGKPRPRPNKWYIEVCNNNPNIWKELSYATDEHGQSYYYERWERINGDESGKGLHLAMRKKESDDKDDSDGILVVVGDHFNYILGRQWNGHEKSYPNANNLVELIDSAIEHNDRETAYSYLSLDGGHGTISSGWQIDCSIQSWNHGTNVLDRIGGAESSSGKVQVVSHGNDSFPWSVNIGNTSWEIFECSIENPTDLEQLFNCNSPFSRL